MAEMKFKIGMPVYLYTMIDRISGVIQDASEKDGEWLYVIQFAGGYVAGDVREDMITVRTIIAPPKYHHRDKVKFRKYIEDEDTLIGVIEIIDAHGTFEQDEEPSYDIFVEEENCIYKHIRESWIAGYAE